MRNKPNTGDLLFIAGGGRDFKPHGCVVHKVGRKYFYVSSRSIPEHYLLRFNISDWSYDGEGNAYYELYLKKSDYDSKIEVQRLSEKISDLFAWDKRRHLGAGKVLAVASILGIEIKEEEK